MLNGAGVDTPQFGAHSTRVASTSAAPSCGIPLDASSKRLQLGKKFWLHCELLGGAPNQNSPGFTRRAQPSIWNRPYWSLICVDVRGSKIRY